MAGENYALVVGARGYDNVPPLRWSDKDARDVAAALEVCGFARPNVTVLHDENDTFRPQRSTLFHHLGRLKGRLDADDLLLFYFSGHGMMQGNDDYLLPIDASDQALKHTAAKITDVVQELQASGSRRVVLLIDACRNELPTGKSIHALGDIAAKSIAEEADDGIAAIFSCEGRERSFEINAEEQSAFTHCLLQAIKAPSVNTVKEVADFLKQEVKVLNGKHGLQPQSPFLVAHPDSLLDLTLFISQVSGDIERYMTRLMDMYTDDKLDHTVFYDVMEFLEADTHPPGPLKLVSDVCEGVSSTDAFGRIWKHLRNRTAPAQPAPGAFGDLGSPARGLG